MRGNLAGHVDELRRKHVVLAHTIEEEERRPSGAADQLEINRLKREKLKLKEEIERLDPQTVPS